MGLLSSVTSALGKAAGVFAPIGTIGNAIAPFAAPFLEQNAAEQAGKVQKKGAKAQMKFQREMSNTAHQRQMADLEAAGINPILTARYGGASTPGGASWGMPKPELAQAFSAAQAGRSTSSAINLQKETAGLTKEQAKNAIETNDLIREQANQASTASALNSANMYRQREEEDRVKKEIERLDQQIDADAVRFKYEKQRNRNEYAVEKAIGQELRYINSLGRGAQSSGALMRFLKGAYHQLRRSPKK
jgi:hypothetical protein